MFFLQSEKNPTNVKQCCCGDFMKVVFRPKYIFQR
jgi:hypothetical protein